MVRMGFSGTGKGVISSGGRVALKYINNQTVNAEEINIGQEALHASLNAAKSIKITKGKGTLIGGKAQAGKTIEINICGSEQDIPTSLIVAENDEIRAEMNKIEKEMLTIDEQSEENMQKIMEIMDQVSGSNLTDKQKHSLQSIQEQSEALNEEYADLMKRKKELEKDIRLKTTDVFIRINKNIYPRSKIRITWFEIMNDEARGRSIYHLNKEGLVASSDSDE